MENVTPSALAEIAEADFWPRGYNTDWDFHVPYQRAWVLEPVSGF